MIRKLILSATFFCSLAFAGEKYALLIGIGAYSGGGFPALEGPPHDLDAIAAVLTSDYGFSPSNITSLKDGQATRAGILAALDQMIARTHPGDFLLIYYSGHGTSPQDPAWRQPLPIDADAGALVPVDFRRGATAAEIADRLVVGRRDLRPRFEKLDGKVTVFGLLDTCFSQNLMKDVLPVYHGAPRSLSARDLTTRGGIDDDIAGDLRDVQRQTKPGPYPYKTVAWISAAQAGEQAVDLDARVLRDDPHATVDGQPHGQFTNALVRGLRGAADLNHDGKISNSELYDYLTQTAQSGQWTHRPALSMNDTDTAFPQSLALGGRTRSIEVQSAPRANGKVRVKLENAPPAFKSAVSAIPGVEVGDQSPDLILRAQSRPGCESCDFRLYQGNGVPLTGDPLDESKAIARVRAEPEVRALRDLSYPNQKVNASLSLWKDGDRLHQGFFLAGNAFEIHLQTDKQVWPLIVDIDNTGYVTVLYPRKSKFAGVSGDQNLGLNGVRCPCGIEYLKTLLFDREPSGYRDWGGREFDPASPDLKSLLDIARSGVGETTLQIISNPSN